LRRDDTALEKKTAIAVAKRQVRCYNAAMKPISINEKLVWDYDIPEDAQENEAFLRWYVARVLSRGGDDDLRAIGFQTIHDYLPHLNLPREIREFWEWYFGQLKARARYGDLNPLPEAHPYGPGS
jgi:hypothetical protein